jgi:hypothetical protein
LASQELVEIGWPALGKRKLQILQTLNASNCVSKRARAAFQQLTANKQQKNSAIISK